MVIEQLVVGVTEGNRSVRRELLERTRAGYREHVIAELQASPWAWLIKVSDFTDNAVGLFHTTGPKLPKLTGKYSPLVPELRELILRADTPLDQDVKDMIAGQRPEPPGTPWPSTW